MAILDSTFKCPKSLKVMLLGQSRAQRRGMLEALQSYHNWKKRVATKRDKADKE